VEQLAALIALSHERWMPRVVEAILGTTEPTSVAKTLTEAVVAAVGQPVVDALFYEPGVGIVAGFELADGQAVVAKVHRADLVTSTRLAAIMRIQAELAAAGAPAPTPFAGPVASGNGWLTVEKLLEGHSADGYDPAVRRGMATALWNFVDLARPRADDIAIGKWLREPAMDDLWPDPHDLRFDFPGTAAGAEWIDNAAREARATLSTTTLPCVVGHLDWRAQNLAFAGIEVTAIFDWDSVALVPEPALAGSASVIHPIDWRLGLPDPLPSIEQVDAFVADYEVARGRSLDDDEIRVLSAAQMWVVSYGARCQHSDDTLGLFPDVDHSFGWPRLLRELLKKS
jgi:hypothetical protein